MVTCQSSELGWEVTVELPADFLSLGMGVCQVGIRAVLGDSSPVFCTFSTVFPIELFFIIMIFLLQPILFC